jgi:hypothetical protein
LLLGDSLDIYKTTQKPIFFTPIIKRDEFWVISNDLKVFCWIFIGYSSKQKDKKLHLLSVFFSDIKMLDIKEIKLIGLLTLEI